MPTKDGKLYTNDGLELIIPMKASSVSNDELQTIINSDDWTCDIKLDGHFMMAYVNFPTQLMLPSIRYFSRNISKHTGVFTERTENLECLYDMQDKLPSNIGQCIFAGELVHCKGKDAITSVIGGSKEHSLHMQKELGKPVFCPFDIIMYHNCWIGNTPLFARKDILNNILVGHCDLPILFDKELLDDSIYHYDSWNMIPTLETLKSDINLNYNKKIMWDFSQECGFEGLVHKHKDSTYNPGYISNYQVRVRSSKDWIKQKIKREFDVVITGFTNAKHGETGQFDGLIGAVVFSQYKNGVLTEIGQASGFDVETRLDMTTFPDKYLSKVAVIEAQERSSLNDRLRHAQYKGLRLDKNPEDCIYNEFES